jgi:hypothetical protein
MFRNESQPELNHHSRLISHNIPLISATVFTRMNLVFQLRPTQAENMWT